LFNTPGVRLSKQQDECVVVRPIGETLAESAGFDIIKACEGYIASFEAKTPEETSPSYLHGWRMGLLGQGRYELSRKADREEA